MTIAKLLAEARHECSLAKSVTTLNQVKVKYLGKKGLITAELKSIAALPKQHRAELGAQINQAKSSLQAIIQEKEAALQEQLQEQAIMAGSIDPTLPGRGVHAGTIHPISVAFQRVINFFTQLGFAIVDGPEIETPAFNFDSLNMPADHPARAMFDTFYCKGDQLLRTHTSPVQIRTMLDHPPPYRIIAPGRVYRRDSDATHTPMFHQLEVLHVDKDITFANLKFMLQAFLQDFFSRSLEVRLRPSYFPFTEPSAEVDMTCVSCHKYPAGCPVCKDTGWIEILGCGLVHPQVLSGVGIDASKYSGWAFGVGIDRLAMLRHGIDDLRIMFDGDINFLSQFTRA